MTTHCSLMFNLAQLHSFTRCSFFHSKASSTYVKIPLLKTDTTQFTQKHPSVSKHLGDSFHFILSLFGFCRTIKMWCICINIFPVFTQKEILHEGKRSEKRKFYLNFLTQFAAHDQQCIRSKRGWNQPAYMKWKLMFLSAQSPKKCICTTN